MKTKWRQHVYQEFLETDDEFVDKLPFKSINTSTFGLISEAVTYHPVETEEGIHIKPFTEGLNDLKEALQQSGGQSRDFKINDALDCLSNFGDQWEQKIKENNKWEEMIEIARQNGEMMTKEDLQASQPKKSFMGRLLDFFK